MKRKEFEKIEDFTFARKEGFTLVELLVVVAIIAILSVIGLTIFTSAQANARDARRKADVDAIANAIEVNRSPGAVYYLSLPATGFGGGTVPVDNSDAASKPHYCIRTSTGTSVPSNGTTWADNVACPTAPSAGPAGAVTVTESAWIDIGSWGLSASSVPSSIPSIPNTAKGTNATTSTFGYNVITFKVCARLENNTIYCKPSSQ